MPTPLTLDRTARESAALDPWSGSLRYSVALRSGAGVDRCGSGASDTVCRPEAGSGTTRRDELAVQGNPRNPGNVTPRPGRPPLACHDRGERDPSAEP